LLEKAAGIIHPPLTILPAIHEFGFTIQAILICGMKPAVGILKNHMGRF
jgi:hypothetical protein